MTVDSATARRRLIAWTKDDPLGSEVAAVTFEADRLSARGTAIGCDPLPYRLDCTLATGSRFVTTRVGIDVTGENLSPMFNTMPVLRHRLLDIGSYADDMVMVWISVPDLRLRRSPQRYTHVKPATDTPAVVRFSSVGDSDHFSAEAVFDADGLVIDYPAIARRMRADEGAAT